jgi:hypothetical protein
MGMGVPRVASEASRNARDSSELIRWLFDVGEVW